MTSEETTTMRPDLEAEREQRAAEAYERISKGNHWRDWTYVAEGFATGRRRAMHAAGSDNPVGRGYNTAFAKWMDQHPWARKIDKATRNHLLWVADHLTQIEAWRDTLATNQREAWNHPTTMRRAYERSHKHAEAEAKGEPVQSPMAQLKDKLVALQEENDRLKRQSGSLFDLIKDTPSTIAMVVVETVVASRAELIAREIIKAVKEKRSAHAG